MLSIRSFRVWAVAGAMAVLLAACGGNPTPTATSAPPTATNAPTTAPTAASAATAASTSAGTSAATAAATANVLTTQAATTSAVSLLPTFAATDPGAGISISLANPTPAPTAAPTLPAPNNTPISGSNLNGTPQTPGAIAPPKITPPPSLQQIETQFPDLQPYINSAQAALQMNLADLYQKMVEVYDKDGATGLATFLKQSGLLAKFNIPESYLDLLMVYDKGGLDAVQKLAKTRGLINDNNELVGLLALSSPDVLDQVVADENKLGVTTYPPLDSQGQLAIGIPISLLSQFQSPDTLLQFLIKVGQVKNVTAIHLPIPKTTGGHVNVPYLTGQGPTDIGATAWQKAGFTGKGVKVGILDMGFGGIKGLMNGKDLPTAAHLKSNLPIDQLDSQQETHGTDCAQVVHGAAPDADLYVAYFDDEPSYEKALNFLLQNKVQIISYSIGSAVGPHDGTFGESLLVDQVVKQTGVLWIVAAGNEAVDHSMFQYNDPVGDGQMHFDSQNAALPFQAGAPDTSVTLNWDGNWQGGEQDEYDFTILDKDGNQVASASEARSGNQDDLPYQEVDFQTNPGDVYYMQIQQAHSNTAHNLEVFVNNGILPKWARVPDHSITTPADSNSAFAVGATVLNKNQIEFFSSEGPTGDGRVKPDVSAPDGEVLPDNTDGFFGTSGATPLVAGAAALVLQAYPKLSQAEVRDYLTKNVTTLGGDSPNNIYGAGQIKLPDPSKINGASGPSAGATPKPTRTPKPGAKPTVVPSKPTPTSGTSNSGGNGGNGGNGNVGETGVTVNITDTSAKFNVVNNGVKGLLISTSFEIDGFQGKSGAVAVILANEDGTPVTPPSQDYAIGQTVGTALTFTPGYDQTAYNNVPLFLPNAALSGLSSGTHNLVYEIIVADVSDPSNVVVLGTSDPVPLKVTVK